MGQARLRAANRASTWPHDHFGRSTIAPHSVVLEPEFLAVTLRPHEGLGRAERRLDDERARRRQIATCQTEEGGADNDQDRVASRQYRVVSPRPVASKIRGCRGFLRVYRCGAGAAARGGPAQASRSAEAPGRAARPTCRSARAAARSARPARAAARSAGPARAARKGEGPGSAAGPTCRSARTAAGAGGAPAGPTCRSARAAARSARPARAAWTAAGGQGAGAASAGGAGTAAATCAGARAGAGERTGAADPPRRRPTQ
jgi:hypothetical protein